MEPIPTHLQDAYGACARLAKAHYENFPVASVLVPAALRPHVCAVYAFARQADDFADEAEFEGQRIDRLDDWHARLQACVREEAADPTFAALGNTIRCFDMPLAPFLDLLSAFRQDVTVTRYADFAQLLDYCRRSADPVGRIVLWLFGYRDDRRRGWSDAICSALQLANFWQDVAVDAKKGRIYLPQDDMHRFGVTEADILSGQVSDAYRELLAFQVARTRELFQQGRPLCQQVSGRLGLELKVTWLGGMGILDAIEASRFDTLSSRPAHRSSDWLKLLMNALVPGRFSRVYGAPVVHA
jgi:squalene synthase HpnC